MDILGRLRLLVGPRPAPVGNFDVVRKTDLDALGAGVSYSTVPLDTHVTWIEGSPIWRKVVMATSGASLGTNNQIAAVDAFIALVKIEGYVIGADLYRYPLGYSTPTAYFAVMLHEDGMVMEQHNLVGFSNRRVVLIIDYVPETGLITTWDQALTSWDAPAGTLWDI
jgi:hypothetical protein